MLQESPPVLAPSANAAGVVFASGERFFVRRVPLSPDGDIDTQIELALEAFSPFPATQLYYGFRTNAARTEALIFAAYRKNFSLEETAAWADAAAVMPAFAVWLRTDSARPAGITLREEGERLEAIVWDGNSDLPAAILARTTEGTGRDDLIAEARRQGGLDANVPVKTFSSAVEVVRDKRDLILRLDSGGVEARFDAIALGQADIRDKEVLRDRRRTFRRDRLIWRGFAAVLIGLAACAVLELGRAGTRIWLNGRQAALDARQPLVKKIDQARNMAQRLEEISMQRLLPFEMLNALNNKRPDGLEFSSVTTKGLWQLDLRGQAGNAQETSTFESDIRQLAGIEKVNVLEKSTRDGVTVFRYEINFKPGWYRAGDGA